MKKETFLKLKSQKRKAKLLALFTALSLFGGIINENEVNATTNNSSIVVVNGQEFDVSGVTDEIIAYAKRGHTDGPQAYETWYPDNMSKVVENMEKLYGHTDLVYKVRNDGVKTLSGTAPDGTKYEDLAAKLNEIIEGLKDNEIKPFYKKTGKALREAHNLQKMYKAGAFNE